jgi:hypothetical protein
MHVTRIAVAIIRDVRDRMASSIAQQFPRAVSKSCELSARSLRLFCCKLAGATGFGPRCLCRDRVAVCWNLVKLNGADSSPAMFTANYSFRQLGFCGKPTLKLHQKMGCRSPPPFCLTEERNHSCWFSRSVLECCSCSLVLQTEELAGRWRDQRLARQKWYLAVSCNWRGGFAALGRPKNGDVSVPT